MIRSLCTIAVFCICITAVQALNADKVDSLITEIELDSEKSFEASHYLFEPADSIGRTDRYTGADYPVPKKRKLKAVLLSILLGHFGVHRIYLGTSANVPVAYSLTLGGGLGLLPLIDAIAILSAKDLEKFTNNNKVIMWSEP